MQLKHEEILVSQLPHLQNHLCYLPHVGADYGSGSSKILIVAESHYLPKEYNNRFSAETWYTNPTLVYSQLDSGSKGWINTKGVVNTYQRSRTSKGGLSIFYNLEKAFEEVYKGEKLFDSCVYLNYFQRPAEEEGETINIHALDSKTALDNLLAVISVLQPDKILFVSSKAYNNFKANATKLQLDSLPYVGCVPHPSASSWWNRASVKYGLNEKGKLATGKEKFQRIIKPKEIPASSSFSI